MSERSVPATHAFISYLRADSPHVDQLRRTLEAAGISVWLDTSSLQPGADWRLELRRAITQDALAFLACDRCAEGADRLVAAIQRIAERAGSHG